jgi:uncharacterized membrane protein
MDLYESARLAHISIGVVVLASFWAAALAPKGSRLHRGCGRVYVFSMVALLAATLVIAVGSAVGGNPMRAVFNVYVTMVSVASVWMAWSSIEHKRDIGRYLRWPYKLICCTLGAYGLALLALVPKMGTPARMAMVGAFALLGISIAAAMAWRWQHGADHARWWLSEHLTAMGVNFAATHASFSILALGAVFPALKEPWTRTAILVAWMTSALLVRLWAGRRFLPAPAAPGSDAAARLPTSALAGR